MPTSPVVRSSALRVDPRTNTERVLAHVVAHPGTYLMEVSRAINLAHSAVREQLKWLESEGHVVSEELGRERHYFPTFNPWERRLVPALTSAEAFAVLKYVAERPGLENQSEITERLGLSKDGMQASARTLVEAQVIAQVTVPSTRRPGIGYEVRWRSAGPLLRLLLVKLPADCDAGQNLAMILDREPPV